MRVPKETPLYDDDGNMARTWVLYFQSLQDTENSGGDVVTINGEPVTY